MLLQAFPTSNGMKDDETLKAIAVDLGISDLPPADQEEIIVKLGEVALKNTVLAVLENLPEENMAEFEKISESGDEEKTRYFLKKHIPNFDEISKQEVKKVADDFKRVKAGLS